jgi:hypothetical protein
MTKIATIQKIATAAVSAALLLCAAQPLAAADFGTADEAKAMLQRAVVMLKADPAATIAKFNKGEDGFRDRDLYVFCVNASDAKTTAHINPSIIGQDVRTFKDPTGKAFGEEIYSQAQEGKISEVEYGYPRPGTDKIAPKESYFTRVSGQICGVGFYK